jgi:hypothetical protein
VHRFNDQPCDRPLLFRSDSGTPRLTTEGSSVIHFKDAILHASEDEDELTDLPTKLQVYIPSVRYISPLSGKYPL